MYAVSALRRARHAAHRPRPHRFRHPLHGAVVPISIQTDLDLVESITIISDKNPNPINASFIIPAGTKPEISTRIRLAETTQVMVVVKSAGKLYSASKEVTVTIGGCDG